MTTTAVSNAQDCHLLALLALLLGEAHGIGTATQVIHDLCTNDVSVAPAILGVLAISTGLLCGFAGYRLFKPAFIGSFVAGGYGVAYALEQGVNSDRGYVAALTWLSFSLGGIVGGGTLIMIYSLAVLFVGASGGLFLAYILYAVSASRSMRSSHFGTSRSPPWCFRCWVQSQRGALSDQC